MLSARLLSAVALLAATTALTAPASAQNRVKIEVWHGLTGDLGEAVDETCGRFNASQTEFETVCVGQGNYDQAVQNSIAAFRAGKHPTIVQVFDAGTADLMLSNAFYPTNKLMADNGYNVNWGDYFPGIARYYATSKGEMFSFPYNSSTALLYWNKDMFQKVGKSEAPKTWEEVEEVMKALKAAGVECGMGFSFDTWQTLEQFSAIHNEPIATRNNGYDGLDAELVINKTKFVKHITDMKRWYDEGYVKIKTPQSGQGLREAFESGTCAMIQSSVADHGTVHKNAAPNMNWDVAMLPVYAGTERKNSLVGGASLWVLSGKKPEEYKAAAAFLHFVGKPETALWWSTRTGYIPVTRSGFEYMTEQGFYQKPPGKGREVAIQSLTASEPTPITRGIRLGGFIQIRKEARDGMQAIFANQVPVQAGIDAIVERSNAVLRRFERTYQGKQLP